MAGLPWNAIHVGIAVFTYFRSTFRNFLLLSAVTLVLRVFYRLALYRVYFTPLKHIPTPPVVSIIPILEPLVSEVPLT